jgi:hypothetical protein
MSVLSPGFNPPPAPVPQIEGIGCAAFGICAIDLIVADAEIKVCFARHDDGPGANSEQRFCEIPVESIICTDIGMLSWH